MEEKNKLYFSICAREKQVRFVIGCECICARTAHARMNCAAEWKCGANRNWRTGLGRGDFDLHQFVRHSVADDSSSHRNNHKIHAKKGSS